jgi:hypothetical protein
MNRNVDYTQHNTNGNVIAAMLRAGGKIEGEKANLESLIIRETPPVRIAFESQLRSFANAMLVYSATQISATRQTPIECAPQAVFAANRIRFTAANVRITFDRQLAGFPTRAQTVGHCIERSEHQKQRPIGDLRSFFYENKHILYF